VRSVLDAYFSLFCHLSCYNLQEVPVPFCSLQKNCVGVQNIVYGVRAFVTIDCLFFVTTVRLSVLQRYVLVLRTCVVTFEIHVVKLRVLVTSSVWNVSIDVMAC
jgi:hypothetical protein